jgi:2-oxoglutarate ferredoxin oxidoreductase subunit beta
MKTVFKRTPVLKDCPTHYCPGCGHGIAHRLVAEIVDELNIQDRTIGIAPVGCAVLAYNYLDVDMIEVAHGRAPAVATGMKRTNPDRIIFSYQGDGDLAAIGTAEILHAAHRAEQLTVIFINNAVFGMTGGQMAPTTMCWGRSRPRRRPGATPRAKGIRCKSLRSWRCCPGWSTSSGAL